MSPHLKDEIGEKRIIERQIGINLLTYRAYLDAPSLQAGPSMFPKVDVTLGQQRGESGSHQGECKISEAY